MDSIQRASYDMSTDELIHFEHSYVVNNTNGFTYGGKRYHTGQIVEMNKIEYLEYLHTDFNLYRTLRENIAKVLQSFKTYNDKINYCNEIKTSYNFGSYPPNIEFSLSPVLKAAEKKKFTSFGVNAFFYWIDNELKLYEKLKEELEKSSNKKQRNEEIIKVEDLIKYVDTLPEDLTIDIVYKIDKFQILQEFLNKRIIEFKNYEVNYKIYPNLKNIDKKDKLKVIEQTKKEFETWNNHIQVNLIRLNSKKMQLDTLEKLTEKDIKLFTVEKFLNGINEPVEQIRKLYEIKDKFTEILMSKRIATDPMLIYEDYNGKYVAKMVKGDTGLSYETENMIKEKVKYIDDKIESLKFNSANKFEEKPMIEISSTLAKNRIIWKGSVNDIKELLKLLNKEGLIDNDSVKYSSVIIRDCFIKPDGLNFDYENVRKTNLKGKSRNFEKVKNTITNLTKKNT